MPKAKVAALSSVDLGVTDVAARKNFYTGTWGLKAVAETQGAAYLKGTGPYSHIVALHKRPQAEMLRMSFLAADKSAVEAILAQVRETGGSDLTPAGAIGEPGGGWGFSFKDPEGRTVRVLAGEQPRPADADDLDRPRKISHCVLNSADPAKLVAFYEAALGFRVSDRTAMMTFIRCNTDHHSVAFVKGHHPSLHHIAFEMPKLESVMRGAGRMRDAGFPIEWGVGRHGPGNNVFAYFLSPDEMVIEYTAEVEQVDEKYPVHGPDYWVWPKGRMDHWGIAVGPTERMRATHDKIAFTPELFRAG